MQDLAVCNQGRSVEPRTRSFHWRQPCPGASCFASFSKKLIPSTVCCFSCTAAPSWIWDWEVTCRMLRLTLLPSPGEKQTRILCFNFTHLLTLSQPFGRCCSCLVDGFSLCVISPLNFKDMYLHEKNKGRKTTCKLSQEKPLLKAISLLTDGRMSWKANTIFTKFIPLSKPKKCYLILSPVYVYVLE